MLDIHVAGYVQSDVIGEKVLDLHCSGIASSAAINIDMNGRICGALVLFGCYQHRHNQDNCVPIHIRLSLELS